MDYADRLEKHKKKIIENINYGKEIGVNKISAIFMLEDEERDKIEKDLITWLIIDGYKVALRNDEVKILVVEW
ncbi:hypothetical protein [Clostridium sp.]|uniref:hypothetical protein n=1 Tax=Clostridium sp. TaxID=1506 RepID=UPI003F331C21